MCLMAFKKLVTYRWIRLESMKWKAGFILQIIPFCNNMSSVASKTSHIMIDKVFTVDCRFLYLIHLFCCCLSANTFVVESCSGDYDMNDCDMEIQSNNFSGNIERQGYKSVENDNGGEFLFLICKHWSHFFIFFT